MLVDAHTYAGTEGEVKRIRAVSYLQWGTIPPTSLLHGGLGTVLRKWSITYEVFRRSRDPSYSLLYYRHGSYCTSKY